MRNIFRLSFLYCKLNLPVLQYRIFYKSFPLSCCILTFYILPNPQCFSFRSIYKVISLISFVLESVSQTFESVLRLFALPFSHVGPLFPAVSGSSLYRVLIYSNLNSIYSKPLTYCPECDQTLTTEIKSYFVKFLVKNNPKFYLKSRLLRSVTHTNLLPLLNQLP
jgi:hypothetical protein